LGKKYFYDLGITLLIKINEFVKSRHSGEPRIESGAGSGVYEIYSHLKNWIPAFAGMTK
jgi:hypothetical protein